MTETIRIYVTCDRYGQRGPLYTARLSSSDGEVLVAGTTEPALDAARVLIARGFDPASTLEMWDGERPFPRLHGVLEVMAGQTVIESKDRSGLQFGRYLPFQDAVSHAPVPSKDGDFASEAIAVAPDTDGPVRESSDSNADLSGEGQP